MSNVVVVGAGVGGLSSAVLLGRQGHRVTLLEHDAAPSAADVEAAFAADRQGAPQVHQTHGILARLSVELRDRLPDVYEALLAEGCVTLPTTVDLGEPQPGDEDLRVLVVRRTTLDWVLRRAALDEPNVTIRNDVTVEGLVARQAEDGGPAAITGVRTSDGEIPADVVVLATGRRSRVPEWLEEVGVEVDETVVESGLMYMTRWYRMPSDAEIELGPRSAGDLRYIKYMAVPGDGDTLSVTIAIRTEDRELRRALAEPDLFDHACSLLPGPDAIFAATELDPLGDVRPMGGLLNRRRRFLADDRPIVLGLFVVGDAHTCTNPLYGRGCSLALVQAGLVADVLAESPDDPTEQALRYEQRSVAGVEPWFDSAVEMDRMGADPADGDVTERSPEAKAFGALMVAAQTDPILGRGMVRFWNVMSTWPELMADQTFVTRMIEVMSSPDEYPLPPTEGPTRDDLLTALEVPA